MKRSMKVVDFGKIDPGSRRSYRGKAEFEWWLRVPVEIRGAIMSELRYWTDQFDVLGAMFEILDKRLEPFARQSFRLQYMRDGHWRFRGTGFGSGCAGGSDTEGIYIALVYSGKHERHKSSPILMPINKTLPLPEELTA